VRSHRAPWRLDGERFHLGSDGKSMTATLAALVIHADLLPSWGDSITLDGERYDRM